MRNPEKPQFSKILLVDDDEAFIFLATMVLHEMHVAKDIQVARDGCIACEVICQCSCPDLVFLDVNMPRMDGFDVLEHLQRTGMAMTMKIVMLSTSSRKEDRDRAFSYKNVLDYLEKPLTEEMIRRIAAACAA